MNGINIQKNYERDSNVAKNTSTINKTILVTGAAGFIGSRFVMEHVRSVPEIKIVGLDNMNDYYEVSFKEYLFAEIDKLETEHPGCTCELVQRNFGRHSKLRSVATVKKNSDTGKLEKLIKIGEIKNACNYPQKS